MSMTITCLVTQLNLPEEKKPCFGKDINQEDDLCYGCKYDVMYDSNWQFPQVCVVCGEPFVNDIIGDDNPHCPDCKKEPNPSNHNRITVVVKENGKEC